MKIVLAAVAATALLASAANGAEVASSSPLATVVTSPPADFLSMLTLVEGMTAMDQMTVDGSCGVVLGDTTSPKDIVSLCSNYKLAQMMAPRGAENTQPDPEVAN